MGLVLVPISLQDLWALSTQTYRISGHSYALATVSSLGVKRSCTGNIALNKIASRDFDVGLLDNERPCSPTGSWGYCGWEANPLMVFISPHSSAATTHLTEGGKGEREKREGQRRGRREGLFWIIISRYSPVWLRRCSGRSRRQLVTLHPVRKQSDKGSCLPNPFLCIQSCTLAQELVPPTFPKPRKSLTDVHKRFFFKMIPSSWQSL